jgi:acetolactate synthase-1/2/3 large subunit
MHGCDVMLNIGARFDDRVTGKLSTSRPGRRRSTRHRPLLHQQERQVDVPIVGDAGRVLAALIEAGRTERRSRDKEAIAAWWRQIDGWRAQGLPALPAGRQIIKPQHAVKRLYEITQEIGRETFITTEVGQHQMWAAQYFGFEKPNRWMTSGGLGTMGYGPAGRRWACRSRIPTALVIDIAGEASILMNIQEMATLAQYRLPVKVFILNNEYMGMVRQWQELLHGGRYSRATAPRCPTS